MIDADATVAALTAHADSTALLVDFDGSLATIVERPEDARPLPDAVSVLERLTTALGRVAVVSGRPVAFLATQLPIDGVAYAGLYGMERLVDGEYSVDPRVQPYLVAVAAATAELAAKLPNDLIEPKAGISVTVHWRPRLELEDEIATRHGLAELNTRKAIELRPPIEVDKANPTAVLIAGFDVAAFAGDDYGDLPAFAELARAVADGRLHRGVRIGVNSAEAPPELAESVDLLVEGPVGLLALLTRVADEIGEPVGR